MSLQVESNIILNRRRDHAVSNLLSGVPDEGGSVKRITLERMIRMSFDAGVIAQQEMAKEDKQPPAWDDSEHI